MLSKLFSALCVPRQTRIELHPFGVVNVNVPFRTFENSPGLEKFGANLSVVIYWKYSILRYPVLFILSMVKVYVVFGYTRMSYMIP
ncbi:hypothetical protein D3C78_1640710 [compost metagenome]